jgi:putative two-component system response regulator
MLIEGWSEDPDPSKLQGAEADDVWSARLTRGEALTRIQSMLQLKSYIDEQAAAVVLSLARTIEARDSYTRDHSERLATSAVALGVAVGLSDEQVGALRIAGIVHDVGKVVVPDAILLKPGPLTPEEAAIMRKHPAEGERICSPLKSFRRVLPIIRHHHERMDGSGYPDGLRGNAIPLSARILQVVDIYDALTTDRPYRLAFTPSQALATLYSEADRGWLDIELVRIFAPVAAMPRSTHNRQVPAKTEKLRSVV